MDIQQQTKNVAAQGRFGDSMLLHVNPAEVKGLASAVPLTVNPETGQPEAFLPFLAPVLGSMLAPTILAGTGLSAGAMAGIGAGLATYAQTGGSGSKALLSGLTAGMGTKALSNVANPDLASEIATSQVASGVADTGATTLASQQAAAQAAGAGGTSAGQSLNTMFSGGFDEGMKNLAGAAMTPSGMTAGASIGAQSIIASQEEFERQMAQMGLDEEERKRKMYEMYPEQIPMASGGRTGFKPGGQTGYNYPAERDEYIDRFSNNFNYGGYNNPYQINSLGNVFNTPRQRRTRPIGRGFMPGFMPEYSYFQGINPSATALGYDPLGTSQRDSRSRGIQTMPPSGGFMNEGGSGYTPPPPPPQMFGGYGNPFMQSPSYQGFYGVPQMQQTINPYASFSQMPVPYQPYQPYVPPVETPPDDGGTPPDDSSGTGSGGTLPPIDIPGIYDAIGDTSFGRKGAVTNPDPIAPPDNFVNPIVNPPVGGPAEPPITPPVNIPGGREQDFYNTRPGIQPPGDMDFGGKPGTPPIVTPPPTITIPIEGGADVTIPDYSRPQPPVPEPVVQPIPEPVAPPAIVQPPVITPPVIEPPIKRPEPPMSIGGPGGGMTDLKIEPPMQNTGPAPIKNPVSVIQAPAPESAPATQSFFDMFPDAPQRPQMSTMDIRSYIDPVTGLRKQGSSTDVGYRNKLKEYLDSNPEASANYYERNPLLSEEEIAERNKGMFNPIAQPNLRASINTDIQGTLPEPTLNPMTGTMEQPLSEFKPIATAPIAPPVMPSPGQKVGEPSFAPYMPEVILDGPQVSMEEAQASAIANGAGRPLTPPVQSVTTPQPIGQEPQPPQTGGIPITGGGPLGSGILPVANLPSGPTAPTAPAPRAIQGPTGPAMGGISAVPTPAAPPQNVGFKAPKPMKAPAVSIPNQSFNKTMKQPKSPMSVGGIGGGNQGGIFGAPMFAAGGDTDLPNEGLEALSKTEKGREAVEAMGYQEGGQTDIMQDPVTQDVIMFILGETDNENAINAFVEKYGAEQFMFLRDKILKQAAGNPDAQTEGLIQGDGNSGMADDLPGVIGNKEKIAVSQDEFIVPADVVSMLGDGSSDAGSKQLYNMMDRVRQAKTGGTTQAPPLNPQKVLPA